MYRRRRCIDRVQAGIKGNPKVAPNQGQSLATGTHHRFLSSPSTKGMFLYSLSNMIYKAIKKTPCSEECKNLPRTLAKILERWPMKRTQRHRLNPTTTPSKVLACPSNRWCYLQTSSSRRRNCRNCSSGRPNQPNLRTLTFSLVTPWMTKDQRSLRLRVNLSRKSQSLNRRMS